MQIRANPIALAPFLFVVACSSAESAPPPAKAPSAMNRVAPAVKMPSVKRRVVTSTEYDRDGDYVTAKRSRDDNYVAVDCPTDKTLIGGGCQGVGGDGILASRPQGNTWICQFEPRDAPLTKTAYAMCASRPDGYQVVTRSAAALWADATCPAPKTVYSGGCSGTGGDAILAARPVGATWLCQFEPRAEPLTKEARSICAARPPGYQTVVNSRNADVVSAACPGTKRLIAGGCHGTGGDAVTVSMPQGNAWICLFKPRANAMQKTATAICIDR